MIWFIAWIIISSLIQPNTKPGFGAIFDTLNTLFAGWAFAGVIFTIYLQRKELSLQRHELSETRKEFQTQNDTLKLQRFENTFFQLLNLHHQIVDKLNYEYTNVMGGKDYKYEKREVFRQGVESLLSYQSLVKKKRNEDDTGFIDIPVTKIDDAEEYLSKAYKTFYKKFRNRLAHYFRNVYHILKFIYTSELIQGSDKDFYASIVRAQLSSDELLLIFYNSLIKDLGYPNFLFLIKEFDLLQNFDFNLITHEFHKEIFETKLKEVKNPFISQTVSIIQDNQTKDLQS